MSIHEQILDFVQNIVIVQQYGLLAVFFVHMIPSFFFVQEGIDAAATLTGFSPISIVIFAMIGGTVGDFIWYYVGRYSYRKIKKREKMESIDIVRHYKKFAFLYAAFPGGEVLMVYAGIRRFNVRQILPFVAISNILRSSITVSAVIGLLTLPDFLAQIF